MKSMGLKSAIRLRHIAQAALAGCALLNADPVAAQEEEGTTPGAIANPGSYQGSMQLQQQEQQDQQTLQRLNQVYAQSAPNAAGDAGGGATGHAAPAVNWWNRPALGPDRNPLLGRWQQVAAKSTSAPVDSMLAGGCRSMFGSGVIAFEPAALQWVAPDGHEELLNNVAYRASGAEIIVLTKDPGAVPALVFGFPDRDRAVVAFFNCTMNRVGAKSRAAQPGAAGTSATGTATASDAAASGLPNAVLELHSGAGANATNGPMAGVQFWVTTDNPADALIAAGLMADANVPLAQFLDEDCRNAAHCLRDWNTMTAKALGSVRTDSAGRARTPSIPSGRYYIVGRALYQSKTLFWSLPVDARPGSNVVLLNTVNGTVLHD
jgi:hypothetical protein